MAYSMQHETTGAAAAAAATAAAAAVAVAVAVAAAVEHGDRGLREHHGRFGDERRHRPEPGQSDAERRIGLRHERRAEDVCEAAALDGRADERERELGCMAMRCGLRGWRLEAGGWRLEAGGWGLGAVRLGAGRAERSLSDVGRMRACERKCVFYNCASDTRPPKKPLKRKLLPRGFPPPASCAGVSYAAR